MGMTHYQLKLFIAGQTGGARQALSNLRAVLEDILGNQYELEVIDILGQPQRAEEARILATPALIREDPPPMRRVIGDFSDRDRVLSGLALPERNGEV